MAFLEFSFLIIKTVNLKSKTVKQFARDCTATGFFCSYIRIYAFYFQGRNDRSSQHYLVQNKCSINV